MDDSAPGARDQRRFREILGDRPSRDEPVDPRRRSLLLAAAGTTVAVLGGLWVLGDDGATEAARSETRADGRPRLPPGQRVLRRLKDMGGRAGDPSREGYELRIHGAVEAPFTIDLRELLAAGPVEQVADVHCVTGWSMLGGTWSGVRIADLATRAKPRAKARHVLFEAAHGYTANVRLDEALAPDALVTWALDGTPLATAHGAPVRALVPDLYFWKSAKWLTGIRFLERDEPGYWEVRGYHNHADPWREERYA